MRSIERCKLKATEFLTGENRLLDMTDLLFTRLEMLTFTKSQIISCTVFVCRMRHSKLRDTDPAVT
jgi:hypothetical protein